MAIISPICSSRVAGGGEGGGGLTPAMTLNSAAGIGVDDLRRLCILRSLPHFVIILMKICVPHLYNMHRVSSQPKCFWHT